MHDASPMARDFKNVSVFLVEDEFLLAAVLQRDLEQRGFRVFGPYSTLEAAQAAVGAESYDVAIMDINLHGQLAFPVVDELLKRDVPLIMLTGYEFLDLPKRFRDITRLSKPYDIDVTLSTVERLLDKRDAARA
jgi:DNA-binding response OmpR family regulator